MWQVLFVNTCELQVMLLYTPGTGWNACSSCHGDPSKARSLLILPGTKSHRVYGTCPTQVTSTFKQQCHFDHNWHCSQKLIVDEQTHIHCGRLGLLNPLG